MGESIIKPEVFFALVVPVLLDKTKLYQCVSSTFIIREYLAIPFGPAMQDPAYSPIVFVFDTV